MPNPSALLSKRPGYPAGYIVRPALEAGAAHLAIILRADEPSCMSTCGIYEASDRRGVTVSFAVALKTKTKY
jgi:hypothetical protein